jgi:hypothetical protein
MPASLVKGARIVPGGTHFMVFSKAREVGELVRSALDG